MATRAWDENIPLDSENAGQGALQMRNKWLDIQERMQINHVWDVSTTYDGEHLDDKIVNLGSVSGNVSINMNQGRIFTMTLSGNITITSITNSGASSEYSRHAILLIKQHSSNIYAVTFPSSWKWHNDTVINVTATASYTSVYMLQTFNGGTTWIITHAGDYNI